MELTDLLMERFAHRTDAFARQKYDPKKGTTFRRYYEGQCFHDPPHNPSNCPDIHSVYLTSEHISQHLAGKITIGLYQLGLDSTIKWLCLDVDGQGGYDTSEDNLQKTTRALVREVNKQFGDGHVLVEQSGSKGYHIWMFFSEPIPAVSGYRLGHFLTSAIEPSSGISIEVYPKQTTLGEYGNLVKLPLGIHRKTNKRCLFVNGNFEPFKDQLQALNRVVPLTRTEVDDKTRHIPAPTFHIRDRNATQGLPCFDRVMREGAIEGTRDTWMLYLGNMCRTRGFPPDIGLMVVEAVNEKSHPPLDPEVVAQKVSSAYDSMYSMFPCRTPQVDSYCSSSCPFWTKKVADRWRGDPVQAIGKISRD